MLPVTVAGGTGAAALAYATSELVWNYLAQQETDQPRLQWDAILPQGRLLPQALLGSGITLRSVATGLLAVAVLPLALTQGATVAQALAGRRRPDRSPTAGITAQYRDIKRSARPLGLAAGRYGAAGVPVWRAMKPWVTGLSTKSQIARSPSSSRSGFQAIAPLPKVTIACRAMQ
jgi:hypothetical protein